MKLPTITLIFLSSAIAHAGFEPLQHFQKSIIDDEMTGSNVAMVYQNEKTVYYHAENSMKSGDKSVTPKTIFPIWSMSKPITIVAMMTLHEQGLVDFEDSVSKYIPEFANLKCRGDNGTYDCENELKVIHLMTHRSGLGYHLEASHKGFTSSIKYQDLKTFVEDVVTLTLAFEPGEQYLYGINQAILGRIVEVITGKTFYEYLKEKIFDPLGMDDTKFYLTDGERVTRFQPLYINSGTLKGFTYELDGLSYAKSSQAYFGGEGLVSTITDYSNFCRMLLDGGQFEGKKIISKKSIELMTQKHTEGFPMEENAGTNKLGFYYGFSLFVLDDPEVDGVGASKGIWGWSGYHNTHFWIDTEKDLFVVFMSRARGGAGEIRNFQNQLRKAVYRSLN